MNDWILNDTPSKVFPLYSRANVGEVFPDPITPLNATAGFLANLEPGWRDAYVSCQVWDHDIYDERVEHNPIACFGGYLFINMSLMRLFGVRVPGFSPEAVDLQYFGDMPGIPSYESERRDFDESPEWSERAGAWLLSDVLGATSLAELDAQRAEVDAIIAARPDLTGLSDAELAERVTTTWAPLFQQLFRLHIIVSLKAGIGLGALAQVCGAIGKPELSLTLARGIGDVDSAGPSRAMWDLARLVANSAELTRLFDDGIAGLLDRLRAGSDADVAAFVARFDEFLAAWGFRGPNEWELRSPTWGTQPSLALALIDRVRLADASTSPLAALERGGVEREAAAAEVRAMLAGNDAVLPQFEAALHAATLWGRGRERTRTTTAILVHEQRLAALELGRRATSAGRLDRPEQLFMLTADELASFVAGLDVAALVRDREATYLDLFDLEPPFVVDGTPPPLSEWKRRSTAAAGAALTPGESIVGVPGCPGVARGVARVVLDPSDPSQLEAGEVLVAPITDPSWTPLFVAASAVVVQVGSPFSHAAIVSRELGIPCVVSAGDCTTRIPNGALVEVNGTTGTVTVVE
ncbi:MAG TPA: PEP-utilizing enzyme [Acidimicrobiia bacterium]|nr:PEP-utilizing enzyme [Acidimicrobiia bacterium]